MSYLRVLRLTLLLFFLALPTSGAELLGAKNALNRAEKTASEPGRESPAMLLRQVREYRAQAAALPPSEAASRWFILYDKIRRIDQSTMQRDYAAYDIETRQLVGAASMLASLPPPPAWPALRLDANGRAQAHPTDAQDLALRLVTEVLTRDRTAVVGSLRGIEDAAARLDAAPRRAVASQVAQERAWLAALYGTRNEVAESFVARVAEVAKQERPSLVQQEVPIPDLVGLVGEARARTLIIQALSSPISFSSEDGDATRVLVRRLALEHIEELKRAQWGLVDAPDALPLYEGLRRRFELASGALQQYDEAKKRADLMYFIGLIAAGRQGDAERQLEAISGEKELEMPKPVVLILHRSGQSEALFRFLDNLLRRRPELNVWSVYVREAAYTGHSSEALALIESLLARMDLPDNLARTLRLRRIEGQLADDQTEAAAGGLYALLSVEPSASDPALGELAKLGVQAAGLGRLLGRPDLSTQGFAYVEKYLALLGEDRFDRLKILTDTYAEMRKEDRADRAEALAISELQRAHNPATEAYSQFTGINTGTLSELAGIYNTAKRPSDVMYLFDEASGWGVTDLAEIVDTKDSLGAPVGLAAARGLAARGETTKALAISRTLLDDLPAYDPTYELFVDLAGEGVIEELDRRYAQDRFEPRPLIWKAIVLNKSGHAPEAEAAAKAAIAIDPSDGAEGPGDRLRAYSVLASALEAKGDITSAKTYRDAVQAIRLSEQADDLNAHGLYRRARHLYEQALAQFSDAYCIQSRLAVQMSKAGLSSQALMHYQRAYELMPESFGRVESHCLGCESVFDDPAAQNVAEQVFTQLVEKTPKSPQAHYMLGYLRQQQGRYAEALESYRIAARLDSEYLNAWRHLQELESHTYIEPTDRDVTMLKLIELDPQQRHVSYSLKQATDLRSLWVALDRFEPDSSPSQLYPLGGSSRAQKSALENLPEAQRKQFEEYRVLAAEAMAAGRHKAISPRQAVASHVLITSIRQLLGVSSSRYEIPDE